MMPRASASKQGQGLTVARPERCPVSVARPPPSPGGVAGTPGPIGVELALAGAWSPVARCASHPRGARAERPVRSRERRHGGYDDLPTAYAAVDGATAGDAPTASDWPDAPSARPARRPVAVRFSACPARRSEVAAVLAAFVG